MELKRYLVVIGRRWWIVVGVAFVTVAALWFVWPPPTVYETSGTYVVRPRSSETGESVRATEALNRGVEINATYARIARSTAVKERAQGILASQAIPTEDLAVQSEVVAGTNILEIGARGSNPEAVAAYATAVGEVAADYLDELDEVYLLQALDPPGDPDVVASNRTLTALVGLIFGLLAGAVLSFGLEYLREPTESGAQGIWDRLTGLYSDDYFVSRLHQELGRCRVPPDLPSRTGSSPSRRATPLFTVGLVSLSSGDWTARSAPSPIERRDAGQALQARLRPQDVLASVGDDLFAVIFPDLGAESACEILDGWRDRLPVSVGAVPASMTVSWQICECNADGLLGVEEIVRNV